MDQPHRDSASRSRSKVLALKHLLFDMRVCLICFTYKTLVLFCPWNNSSTEKAFKLSFLRWTSRFQNDDLCDPLQSVEVLLIKWLYAARWALVRCATADISPVSHITAEKLKPSIGWVQLNLQANLPRCPSGKWENHANTTFILTWGRLGETNIFSAFPKPCVKDVSGPNMFCMHGDGDGNLILSDFMPLSQEAPAT